MRIRKQRNRYTEGIKRGDNLTMFKKTVLLAFTAVVVGLMISSVLIGFGVM